MRAASVNEFSAKVGLDELTGSDRSLNHGWQTRVRENDLVHPIYPHMVLPTLDKITWCNVCTQPRLSAAWTEYER